MMGHIFYFFGLIIFMSNLNLLLEYFDYIKIKEWSKSFEKVTKKPPLEKEFKKGDLVKYRKYNGILALNFLWLFLGIITASWKIFLILLILNFFTNLICKLIGEFRIFSVFLNFTKNILIVFSILILCVNHFHLHLDLYNLLCRSIF